MGRKNKRKKNTYKDRFKVPTKKELDELNALNKGRIKITDAETGERVNIKDVAESGDKGLNKAFNVEMSPMTMVAAATSLWHVSKAHLLQIYWKLLDDVVTSMNIPELKEFKQLNIVRANGGRGLLFNLEKGLKLHIKQASLISDETEWNNYILTQIGEKSPITKLFRMFYMDTYAVARPIDLIFLSEDELPYASKGCMNRLKEYRSGAEYTSAPTSIAYLNARTRSDKK